MAPPCVDEPKAVMGKGGKREQEKAVFTWDEVAKHDKRDDRWVVIEGQVYNVTTWAKRHPGGSKVLDHYAGQDAIDAFTALHIHIEKVKKYLKPLHIGSVQDTQIKSIDEDFRKLRATAVQMGLFKPSYFYFFIYLGHILLLIALAYLTLVYFGTGWIPFIVSILLYGTAQTQALYLQHDFSHSSVFNNRKVDQCFQHFTAGFLKGFSAHYWTHHHRQHHAKPNVIDKDSDINVHYLFLYGDVMPVEVAKKWKKSVPFNHQHKYFFIFGPPLFTSTYFHYSVFRHVYNWRLWLDGSIMAVYFFKFFYFMVPLVGWGWTFFYYEAFRIVESIWFFSVGMSNHVPMKVDHDDQKPWLKLQMSATCNVEQSFFNDWFTGHLNFQIEHHLFPTMPRHNLYKIQPLVKSLCKKHGIPFLVKSPYNAFADIVRSLKRSGELWNAAYHAHHSS